MPTYPVIAIAVLQGVVIFFGSEMIHARYGDWGFVLLSIPILWTFLARYLQASRNEFWLGTVLPYVSGLFLLMLLICFFSFVVIELFVPAS